MRCGCESVPSVGDLVAITLGIMADKRVAVLEMANVRDAPTIVRFVLTNIERGQNMINAVV